MGYYTHYELELVGEEKAIQDVLDYAEAEKVSLAPGSQYLGRCGLRSLLVNDADEWTWYEHDDDMKALSRMFPLVGFLLSGEGEEQGDVWRKHYAAGDLVCEQQARLVWE